MTIVPRLISSSPPHQGELWRPDGRLYDWGWAGYKEGKEDIPSLPATVDIRDFGAKGDGFTDDTKAIAKALEEVNSGIIYLPKGAPPCFILLVLIFLPYACVS